MFISQDITANHDHHQTQVGRDKLSLYPNAIIGRTIERSTQQKERNERMKVEVVSVIVWSKS